MRSGMLNVMSRRTSIVVDDALLAEAQRVLGTTGLKDTVERSLHEVVRMDRRRRLLERIKDPDGFDDDALAEARRAW